MHNSYKLCTSTIAEKLQRDLDLNLTDNQTGFRKERGILEYINILRHIIEKHALFANLTAAFDLEDK